MGYDCMEYFGRTRPHSYANSCNLKIVITGAVTSASGENGARSNPIGIPIYNLPRAVGSLAQINPACYTA